MDGQAILNDPFRNRGTAFTVEERKEYGLTGMLPIHVQTLEEQAAQEDVIRQLYEWLDDLTPVQRRRIYARYMLGMKISDIAALEQITPGQASDSIRGGIKKLRRRFLRQKRNGKL